MFFSAKSCCRSCKKPNFVNIKYIIKYNVSNSNKNLNINKLAGDTPKTTRTGNYIHSSSEFFNFLFSNLLTCLYLV